MKMRFQIIKVFHLDFPYEVWDIQEKERLFQTDTAEKAEKFLRYMEEDK